MNSYQRLMDLLPDDNTAALVTSSENRLYLSDFASSAGAVLVTKKAIYLLVDFRYGEAAEKSVSKDINVIVFDRLFESINKILSSDGISAVLIEEKAATVFEYSLFTENLNAKIIPNSDLSQKLLDLRMIKQYSEIEKIKTAQRITEKSYLEILNYIKPGVSEKKIALELEYLMKLNGAQKAAFDLITITGDNTSLPHGVPTEKVIKEGDFFTMDIGAVYDGYHSDMTRTVAVSYATDKMQKIYSIVLEAHKAAANRIKYGIPCRDVDIAAREIIENNGYGKYFGHTTGHGVGLEIHENPVVYKTSKTVLKENMIITDEPGIYLPGEFGVRIEDMYLITEDGHLDLASVDKDLLIV